jgi:hypothetical protein
MMDDEGICGETFEIDSYDLVGDWPPRKIRTLEGATLVCSRPLNHTPANVHSDGVTDWLGDE